MRITVMYLAAALMCFPLSAAAADPAPTEIIRKTDSLLRGNTSNAQFEMTVSTPNWSRTLKGESWSSNSWEKAFIRISSPAKEAGTGSLKIGNEMWNYVPKVERVIKIPPSMMLQGWMESDFTNDDLVKESSIVNDYTHRILRNETVRGDEAWVLELLPKPQAAVVWGKQVIWARKSDFVPLRQEFYDEKGKLVRVLSFSQIENIGDRNYPHRWEMESLEKTGHKTVLRYSVMKINGPVDEGMFSLKKLQNVR